MCIYMYIYVYVYVSVYVYVYVKVYVYCILNIVYRISYGVTFFVYCILSIVCCMLYLVCYIYVCIHIYIYTHIFVMYLPCPNPSWLFRSKVLPFWSLKFVAWLLSTRSGQSPYPPSLRDLLGWNGTSMEVGSGHITAAGLKESVAYLLFFFFLWRSITLLHATPAHVVPAAAKLSKVLLCDAVHIAIPAWEGVAGHGPCGTSFGTPQACRKLRCSRWYGDTPQVLKEKIRLQCCAGRRSV